MGALTERKGKRRGYAGDRETPVQLKNYNVTVGLITLIAIHDPDDWDGICWRLPTGDLAYSRQEAVAFARHLDRIVSNI
jgi:hypothetical protein